MWNPRGEPSLLRGAKREIPLPSVSRNATSRARGLYEALSPSGGSSRRAAWVCTHLAMGTLGSTPRRLPDEAWQASHPRIPSRVARPGVGGKAYPGPRVIDC